MKPAIENGRVQVLLSLVILLAFPSFAYSADPVVLKLSATDLPPFDPFSGNPDPYVVVSYAFGQSENFTLVEKTSALADTSNPDWTETFKFDYVVGTSQRVKLELYDEDPLDADDFMASITCFLSEIRNANGSLIKSLSPQLESGSLILQNLANYTSHPGKHEKNKVPEKISQLYRNL